MTARFLALVLVLSVLAGCGSGQEPDRAAQGGTPVVYTTFSPTTWMVERIAGDLVKVVCPVPADEDAIFWQPSPETIAAYQAADLIVVNGAEFEKWVLTASLPEAKVVDTAASFRSDWIEFANAVTHSHGPAGEHAHAGIDGHTWLDPRQALAQAEAVHRALKALLPEQGAALDANWEELRADLADLDEGFREATAPYEGEAIYASHPAYNYVARRYGWNVVNLNLDPEEMPDDAAFEAVRGALAERPARYLLWESDPRPDIARRFEEELGLLSVTFSPAELLGEGEDYLAVMRANLVAVSEVLTPGG